MVNIISELPHAKVVSISELTHSNVVSIICELPEKVKIS